MRLPVALLIGASASMLACADDAENTSTTAGTEGSSLCEPTVNETPDAGGDGTPTPTVGSNPYENTIVEMISPTTSTEFENTWGAIIGPDALAALASPGAAAIPVELTPGMTMVAMPDPSSPDQIRLQFTSEPVAEVYPEAVLFADVAVSTDLAGLFYDVALGALATAEREDRAEGALDDFDLGIILHDDAGGQLTWEVRSRGGEPQIRFEIASPRTSVLPGRLNSAFEEGAVWERMWARAPLALDFGTIRTVLLSGVASNNDGGEGVSAGVCGSSDIDATTAPHSWYQFCVDVGGDVVEVQLGFKNREGTYRQLALAPATVPAAALWSLIGDRVATSSIGGVAPPTFRVTFDYSDPEFQGAARIDLERAGDRYQMWHTQVSPPRELVAGPGVPLPDPAQLDPGTPTIDGDPCELVGGVEADAGQFVLTFVANPSLASFSTLEFPVSGRVYGALYPADVVGLTGPIEGAVAADSFEFDLTISEEISSFRYETGDMPAGEYKVTAFLDLDDDVDPNDVNPESGDPAVLQFAGTTLRCDRQLQVVEFTVAVP
jgi:hypothetical protein